MLQWLCKPVPKTLGYQRREYTARCIRCQVENEKAALRSAALEAIMTWAKLISPDNFHRRERQRLFADWCPRGKVVAGRRSGHRVLYGKAGCCHIGKKIRLRLDDGLNGGRLAAVRRRAGRHECRETEQDADGKRRKYCLSKHHYLLLQKFPAGSGLCNTGPPWT